MIFFFKNNQFVYGLQSYIQMDRPSIEKLEWLLESKFLEQQIVFGQFVGTLPGMFTPWSTNAIEIIGKIGEDKPIRIERFELYNLNKPFDSLLQVIYTNLDQKIFDINLISDSVKYVKDIKDYNRKHGLALDNSEQEYLMRISEVMKRPLTDSEIFGFSQVNSEHCRHKIFNAKFIVDGKPKEQSLFSLIKKTSQVNPGYIVSAYKDNVSFCESSIIQKFTPADLDKASYFIIKKTPLVISLKAETHNFPTTVEPFNGAATGTGGEIRDRMAGGRGSVPLAGSAVYMTAYPRLEAGRKWEITQEARPWLYQTPLEILIKASDGASDFGNKFGQPLINGSLLTFEQQVQGKFLGYDKVVMLAGGVGYAEQKDAQKIIPKKGDKIVVLGGDNYRIGMGGSVVSSLETGSIVDNTVFNAIQRANPEMQKRVFNVIRALSESDNNFVLSIHDHGAGGHINCFAELVENNGGVIHLCKLPVGDKTLSAKEIIGNESQERMGLIISKKNIKILQVLCDREEAPFYVVGEVTDDMKFVISDELENNFPINLSLEQMFGNTPDLIVKCESKKEELPLLRISDQLVLEEILENVLKLESVACKDWLTNKVDRSVTGRVAMQQTVGPLQLPLANLGVVALDYTGAKGVAISTGHAPIVGIVSPKIGVWMSVIEALTNIIWAPLTHRLQGVSLSANWMWPAKNDYEDARLYEAVESLSDFVCDLGINIPTGKDSLSMVQKYEDKKVYAPGTLIITASSETNEVKNIIEPVIDFSFQESSIIYVDFACFTKDLGGSAFAQTLGQVGADCPKPVDYKMADYIKKTFNTIQELICCKKIIAGHDVSSGGLITTLLEMTFANPNGGLEIYLDTFSDKLLSVLFSEAPALVIQVKEAQEVLEILDKNGIKAYNIGNTIFEKKVKINKEEASYKLEIEHYRKIWYHTSYLFDKQQVKDSFASLRAKNFDKSPIEYDLNDFTGKLNIYKLGKNTSRPRMAIIREKGVNGDREMAYAFYLAGFDVKDIHMTDIISGKENLKDVRMIAFVGGFSNSDVMGAGKGWAASFLYNPRAKKVLESFKERSDTLIFGVCNGCQLMMWLGLIDNNGKTYPMARNLSEKFESTFVTVEIPKNNSVMLKSLSGKKAGIWSVHGEGRFILPNDQKEYCIALKYASSEYPQNPNGSDYNVAGLTSRDGRFLAVMPHLDRSFLPFQCGFYPYKEHEVTLWFEAFVNARNWILSYKN